MIPHSLAGHVAGSLVEPQPQLPHMKVQLMAAPGSLAHRQAVLRPTEAVSLYAINLLLGLPNMLSQLLAADIFQLLM